MNGILALFLMFGIPIIVFLLIMNLLDFIDRQTEKETEENIKILDKRIKKVEKMRKKLSESKGE